MEPCHPQKSLTADTTQSLAPVNILSSNAIALGTTTSPISVVTIQGTSSVQLALDVRGTITVTEGFMGIGTNTPSTELENETLVRKQKTIHFDITICYHWT